MTAGYISRYIIANAAMSMPMSNYIYFFVSLFFGIT